MRNFALKVSSVGAGLGFSAAEIAQVEADADALAWMVRNDREVESYRRAVKQYRRLMLENRPGSTPPSYPQAPSNAPPPDILPGIYRRISETVARVRVAAAYTPEIGALLNILPAKDGSESLAEAKPNPALSVEPGNRVIATFTRAGFDGVELQIRVDKEESWTAAGRYFRSPARLNIPAGPENLPRYVQLRARYLRGNDPVGQYSDTDNISTIP